MIGYYTFDLDYITLKKLFEEGLKPYIVRGAYLRNIEYIGRIIKKSAPEAYIWFPIYQSKRVKRNRITDVAKAFYPGYVFVFLREYNPSINKDLGEAIPSCSFLVQDSPASVPRKEIESVLFEVQEALNNKQMAQTEFEVGEQVRITQDAFIGLIGTIVRFESVHRIVVLLNIFGREVETTVDYTQVTKI